MVTNASFGVDQGDPDDFPIWCSIYDELGSEGIINCAATANANWNIDQVGDVPTACSSQFLIAVTNTDANDNKYMNAAYGIISIDIGAPGTNIYSTFPGDNYGYNTGTSMASPQVAGVIALMYATMCLDMIQNYKNAPGDFALMVRQYLLEGADNISSLNGLVAHGRLNALEAIENIFGINSSISGPSLICTSGSTFSVSKLPTVDSIIWDTGPYLTLYSGQNTNSPTIKATGNGNSWVSVRLVIDCESITLPRKDVWVGNPSFTWDYVNSDTEFSPFEYGFAYPVYAVDEVAMGLIFASTDWSYTGPLTSLEGNLQLGKYRAGRNLGAGYIRYEVANTCGSRWHELYYEVVDNWFLSVSPNPATDETTLTIESVRSEAIDISTEWDLEIYDQMQIVKTKKVKLKGNQYKINTSGWQGGMYFVRIKFKDKILTGKFLLNR